MNKRARFLLFAGTVLFGINCAFFELSCVDVGFHVRTGDLVVRSGVIPAVNSFSFAQPDHPWLLHQWLPSILFYWAWVCGQVQGLILAKALLVGLICATVYLSAVQISGERRSYWHYWLVFGMALAARPRFFVRPFIFSALLLALLQYCIARISHKIPAASADSATATTRIGKTPDCSMSIRLLRRFTNLRHRSSTLHALTTKSCEICGIAVSGTKSRKLLFIVPALMALWANVHAGVLYGLVYIGAFSTGAFIDFVAQQKGELPEGGRREGWAIVPALYAAGPLIGAAVLSVILMVFSIWLINPNGPKVIMLPVIYFLDPFWQDLIQEFRSPRGNRLILLVSGTGLLVLLQCFALRKARWRLAIPASVFIAMAFRSERIILMTLVVTMPYAAFLLSRVRFARLAGAFQVHCYLLPIAWIAATFFVLLPDPSLRYGTGVESSFHPRPIFSFMKDKAAGMRIFNNMRYGGGILLWAYPEIRPFIDGRCEAYSKGFWKDVYVPAASGGRWREIFESYAIQGAIVSLGKQKSPARLARELHEDTGWALVAFDDHTLFFLRRDSKNLDFFDKHEFRLIWPGDRTLKNVTSKTAGDSRAEAKRALEFDGSSVFARTVYARSLLLDGRFRFAAIEYRKLVSEKKVSDVYWRDYAYSLYMAGMYRELLSALDKMEESGVFPEYALSLRQLLKKKNE